MTSSVNLEMGERVRRQVWRMRRNLFTSSVVVHMLLGLVVRQGSWRPVVMVSEHV